MEIPHRRLFDLVAPFTWRTISSESPTSSSSVAPSAAARSMPSSSARYSATLLVARADPLAHLLDDLAVGVADDDADRRRARVAAGAAVDVDRQPAITVLQGDRSPSGARPGAGAPRRSWPPLARAGVPLAGGGVELAAPRSPCRSG